MKLSKLLRVYDVLDELDRFPGILYRALECNREHIALITAKIANFTLNEFLGEPIHIVIPLRVFAHCSHKKTISQLLLLHFKY